MTDKRSTDFDVFFRLGSGGHAPRPYQTKLAGDTWPETLIIPTGFGKTAAVLSAWLWKWANSDSDTPRRLVYCLPMRALVEQTEEVAGKWISAAQAELGLEVGLDVLMGGRSTGHFGTPDWIMRPERPSIIIGTQDMLVSAALMRGYGASRYRWPVDFALLHNDAMWIFDEVQLAGSAIATSSQLEAFRRELRTGRRSRTLWMSATLDPRWLRTVDFDPAEANRPHDLSSEDVRSAPELWRATKHLSRLDVEAADVGKKDGRKAYADAVGRAARGILRPSANTVVFANTVARAQAIFAALAGSSPSEQAFELALVHSRFRRAERNALTRTVTATPPACGRIIVATQALEAGVDLTSASMVTELAPWSSMVQRFGRCNRYGECNADGAEVAWIDLPDPDSAPYVPEDVQGAREIAILLSECGPSDLAHLVPSVPAAGAVIRQRDLLDLFDTEPDLSGFDVDVAPYVRDADDTDVRLFWRPVDSNVAPPGGALEPDPEELCPAPIGGARDLLKRAGVRAWRWDPLAKAWVTVRPNDVFPGMTVWVASDSGGYTTVLGFDAASKKPVPTVESANAADDAGNETMDGDEGSAHLVSLVRHTDHVRAHIGKLCEDLELYAADAALFDEIALWHDLGKAHKAFVAKTGGRLPPLAKWPRGTKPAEGTRRYFRHELVSALGYLSRRGWSEAANLPAYLIASHHGKVRMRLGALPKETGPDGRLFARGVRQDDEIPETDLGGIVVPMTVMDLDIMNLGEGPNGSSWQTRTRRLLDEYGPFRLAWLETIIRIADWRASAEEEEATDDDL